MSHKIIGMHVVEAREFLYWEGITLVNLTGNPRRNFNEIGKTIEVRTDTKNKINIILKTT